MTREIICTEIIIILLVKIKKTIQVLARRTCGSSKSIDFVEKYGEDLGHLQAHEVKKRVNAMHISMKYALVLLFRVSFFGTFYKKC